jgi:DNA-nicking Smr family endonuclease
MAMRKRGKRRTREEAKRLPSRLDQVPRRDPAADRALFEQALERLGIDDIEKEPSDAAQRVEPERQARFAKRVTRGEVEPAAAVDLHGLDRDQASARLRRFLSTAAGETVLVIHGRGAGIVRAAALAELDRHPRVAEHLTAPRHLGGEGARLVRLRRDLAPAPSSAPKNIS